MGFKLTISLAVAAISMGVLASGAQSASRHHAHRIHHKHHARHHHHHHAGHHMASRHHHGRANFPQVSQATRDHVVDMIKSEAPQFGVPTWFALKIAKVESNYNPQVTGGAGEIGVFQLKCQTARGIGFSGSCSGLYNPSTNVRYGLKYLSMAVRSSHGNLRLAASKHNGGLGRKGLVPSYVAMVF